MAEHLSVSERRRDLTADERERLRAAVDPAATLVGVQALVGGVDTATYALRLVRPGPSPRGRDVVVRVFRGWKGDVAAAVRGEYATLEAVSAATPLAPRPVLCDAAGELIGEPLMVTTMLDGAPLPPTHQPDGWTEQLADALVAIHGIPPERVAGVASDRSAEERLARRLADPPPRADPLWDEASRVAAELAPRLAGNPPTLIHGDLWFGNTIWSGGRLSGVVDWAGARIGDPARDVSIARADLRLFVGERSAEVLRARYEAARGALNDLAFWDLLAALDPIRWLEHWVAGYEELGVPLSLGDARARLERWVRADLAALARPRS